MIEIKGFKIKSMKFLLILTIISIVYGVAGIIIAKLNNSKEIAEMFSIIGGGIYIVGYLILFFLKRSKLKLENRNFTLDSKDIRIKKYKINTFLGLNKSIYLVTEDEEFLFFSLVSKYKRVDLSNKLEAIGKELKSENVEEKEFQLTWLKTMVCMVVSFVVLYLPIIIVN